MTILLFINQTNTTEVRCKYASLSHAQTIFVTFWNVSAALKSTTDHFCMDNSIPLFNNRKGIRFE